MTLVGSWVGLLRGYIVIKRESDSIEFPLGIEVGLNGTLCQGGGSEPPQIGERQAKTTC